MSSSEAKSRPTSTRRLFCPTPSWLIFGLLVVEGLLWLSERYRWFWFNDKKGWTVLIGVAVVGGAMLVMLLWFAVALAFRRRFQFSIRSLLILTLAVALPCGWLSAEINKARAQKEAVKAMEEQGFFVYYDYYVNERNPQLYYERESSLLFKLLGKDFVSETTLVVAASEVTDVGLEMHHQTATNSWSRCIQPTDYRRGAAMSRSAEAAHVTSDRVLRG